MTKPTPLPARVEQLEAYAREMSRELGGVLHGGSEWFKKIGDEYYICPKLAGAEFRRRELERHTVKRDLHIARKAKA